MIQVLGKSNEIDGTIPEAIRCLRSIYHQFRWRRRLFPISFLGISQRRVYLFRRQT